MGSELHVLDYVVFAASVLISIVIGAWYARPAAGQQTAEGYLQGDRQLRLLPVMISLCVTYISPITMLGMGAEMYYFGIGISFFAVAQFGGALIAALVWVPLMYPLKLTSANQYLHMRYRSNVASIVGMVLQIVMVIMVTGIALYAPSMLFESFGNFPAWASLLVVGICSTFYTSIGGMKGVVLTDVFQALVMLAGVLTVIVQGFIKVGGMKKAWNVYEEWDRVQLDDFFIPNPYKRLEFFSIAVFQCVMWSTVLGLSQASVLRYCSLPSKKYAIGCVLGVIPGSVVFSVLASTSGLVMFVYYVLQGCDPLIEGRITDVNQLLLQLVMDILYFPGVPGLFIAAIFCSSLSTLSSLLTAMASLVWDDLLRLKFGHWSDKRKTILLKILVCFFGLFATGIGFLCMRLEGTLIKMVVMFTQALTVPLGVLFIGGASLPKLNLKGALLASSLATVLVLWMMIGGELHGVHDKPLRLPMTNCSTLRTTITPPEENHKGEIFFLYRITHFYYGPIGLSFGGVLACLFSLIPWFREKVLIPENLIFSTIRCCFATQKLPHSEEDITEREKMMPSEDNNYNRNMLKVDPFYQQWLYESQQKK